MKKICFVTTNRSDFSRIEPVVRAMKSRDDFDVFLIVAASHLLPDSGETIRDIVAMDHKIDAKAYTIVEGENLETMSKSIGLGCMEFSTLYGSISPDLVVIHGDRFDIFPAVIAASMSNIHIAHIQGGELTGTIDETIRHCITKMSHFHFVSNNDAATRVERLGEDPSFIFNVGCPSVDYIKSIQYLSREEFASHYMGQHNGVVDLTKPYIILMQHPVTTEFGQASDQMQQVIRAVISTGLQTILIYPNVDAGSKHMIAALRKMADQMDSRNVDMFKHIPVQDFLPLLKHATCIVGNSSSGIRESCYFGTPCVNVGSRQDRRVRGQNVIDVECKEGDIFEAISKQITHGSYPIEELYGSGYSAEQIAQILSTSSFPPIQKRMSY